MTKKNKKIAKNKSVAADINACTHVAKSVKYNAVCNSFRHTKIGYCKNCHEMPDSKNEAEEELEQDDPCTCFCLKCGHQACSRQCDHQHAYKHYKEAPSHSICVNINTWAVWCYECDDEVIDIDLYPSLHKVIDFLRRKIATDKKKINLNLSLHEENVQSNVEKKKTTSVKGLKNLGNTCFFNSVVQNLAYLEELRIVLQKLFDETSHITLKLKTENLHLQLKDSPGSLTTSLHNLINEMNTSDAKVLSPNLLLSEVAKKAPQFRGYQQHDSHELLRYLLDSICSEEHQRIEKCVKEIVNEMNDEEKPEEYDIKNAIKTEKTCIDEIFGGEFVSTICCQQCRKKSSVYENFLDISLPVTTQTVTTKLSRQSIKDSKNKTETPHSNHQRKMALKNSRKAAKRSRRRSQSGRKVGTAEAKEIVYEVGCKDKLCENQSDTDSGIGSSVEKICEDVMNTILEDFSKMDIKKDNFSDQMMEEEVTCEADYISSDDDQTLGAPYAIKSNDNSIESILQQFCSVDILEGLNKFSCDHCTKAKKHGADKTVFTNATKQLLVHKLPRVLVLHLKLFEQMKGGRLRKISKQIKFPKQLNMSPFCSRTSQIAEEECLFSLSGVVEHSGSLHGGHYVAHVKSHVKWSCVSDATSYSISEDQVLSKQAYLLFYVQNKPT